MNPFDTVKQRMQAASSSYRNIGHCLSHMYHKEGFRSFYLSLPTSLLLSVPFQAIQFPVYEALRAYANPSAAYDPVTHSAAGAVSGALAAALTTPLDVIKTMLQTRGLAADLEVQQVSGMRHAATLIYQLDGLAGFWRGMLPRILTHAPATAICWATYEYVKFILSDP
jgi:solute carrier family 25 (mitochondrial iron transporter), member 28/37